MGTIEKYKQLHQNREYKAMIFARVFFLGLVMGLSIIIILGYSGDVQAAKKPIKIGVALPITGKDTDIGHNIKTGIDLKLEEINNAGGIRRRKIEIVWGDDRSGYRGAEDIGSQFASDKTIIAVIGYYSSPATLAALPIYKRAGLPLISPSAKDITIGKKGKGWFFRNIYRDDFQGKFLAEYAKKTLKVERVAIFYENHDYAIGLKKAFTRAAKKQELKISGRADYSTETYDFSSQLTKMLKANPDAIFLCGFYQKSALIAVQARMLGFKGLFLGADGIDHIDYIKIAGDAANHTYITAPFIADAAGYEAKEFITDFESIYTRELDWITANAYDCLGILAQVIKRKGVKRKRIRAGLAAMNSFQKGYKGITGITFFNRIGDCQKPAYVKKVMNGKFIKAEQFSPY